MTLEDVDGVGVAIGFKEGAPQDIMDGHYEFVEHMDGADPLIDP